ncbi:MAG: addiction module protein [Verrucomicrobiae bacterium]|nr:addiction module protein [Verrucomicrobiae bacterium]MCP5522117.1 addiction module protein [Verrucomicrobiales bacterium]
MIEAAEIERMSVLERIETMELLWASLSRSPDAVPSPDWHEEVLANRLEKVDHGGGEFLTLEEARARLLGRGT